MIPDKLYRQIVESVPITCVDVVLRHKNKYILVNRNDEPLKGEWWVVGGRMLKGESLIKTVHRKVKEEVGLEIKNASFFGVYEDSYKKSAWGVPTHSVSIVYWAIVNKFEPKLDKHSSDIKLFDKLPKRFLDKLTQ